MRVSPQKEASDLPRLIKSAQTGDNSAFQDLVSSTHLLVRKVAVPLVPGWAVDDVVQETFLLVYRKLHYLKQPDAYRSWLTRIALNVCYSWLRRQKPAEQLDLELLAQRPEAEPEDLSNLRDLLARLKPRERNILILREYLQLSYEEIADVLDLPEGTVRSRLHHARKSLKSLLSAER